MKTAKTTISNMIRISALVILLTAVAASSFGQMASMEGHSMIKLLKNKLFSYNNTEMAYYTAGSTNEKTNVEEWMYDLGSWASNDSPRNIQVNRSEQIIESDLSIESWMTVPFETRVIEEELILEAWMADIWI